MSLFHFLKNVISPKKNSSENESAPRRRPEHDIEYEAIKMGAGTHRKNHFQPSKPFHL
jgi:hypothetical protein